MKRRRLSAGLISASVLLLACSTSSTTAPPPDTEVAEIEVDPASSDLEVGASAQINATAKNEAGSTLDDAPIGWSSDDDGVATVDANGLVSGVGAGSTSIRASSGSVEGVATINVTDPPADTVVATIDVGPSSGTINTGTTLQLTATARNAGGDVLGGASITWSSDDDGVATVDANGLVSGASAGSTVIRATSGGAEGVATVTVSDAAIVSLTVSPPSATLVVGDSITLEAVAINALDDTVAVTVAWTSTAPGIASVDGSGKVSALAEGSASITATTAGVADTVGVTVNPAAQNVLFEESFDDASFAARGWFDNSTMAISTTEKFRGDASLEIHWSAGQTLPDFGGAGRILFEETDRVYMSYRVKYSDNWIGAGAPDHPHVFQFLTTEDGIWTGPAVTRLTTYVETNYDGGIKAVLGMQDATNVDQGQIGVDLTGTTESRGVSGCNGDPDGHGGSCYFFNGAYRNWRSWKTADPIFTNDPGPRYKGDWHLVEAYFQLNSVAGGVGQADGAVRFWVDGELLIDVDDVMFRTGALPDMEFRELLIGPYIGVGSPIAQTMWIDDLVIATGR